eukprot:CAMPEP_0116899454 /NCGR_PEP_ID=MMETSP0467-20121206/8018_1 /TAXON_ID=283647 /ORGANISM="Mesodinium pulex, Strain SPMC105" /LENGTH=46 /DNA_ID= /DNA_START= /DNA_END= /DNA_ORIENTATION=
MDSRPIILADQKLWEEKTVAGGNDEGEALNQLSCCPQDVYSEDDGL